MATVGQQLTAPEAGWRRYDDSNPAFKFSSGWTRNSVLTGTYGGSASYSPQSGTSDVSFNFIGTKLRYIGRTWNTSYSTNIEVIVDGVPRGTFSQMGSSQTHQVLNFELTGLSEGVHSVVVKKTDNNYMLIDAIDIDSNGRLLHPDEVTNPENLAVGKRIRANYSNVTGKVGAFRGIGLETRDFIPAVSAAVNDGDFYLICVDVDREGRLVTLADRNIQHSVSWDSINSTGMVNGLVAAALSNIGAFLSPPVYVDPVNGLDTNTGSPSRPVKTISKAIALASEGGAVILKSGTHVINTANKWLHDLCTTKGLSFIGEGLGTVLEVPACPVSYAQAAGTSAYFYNMAIRSANNHSGDTRAIWYNDGSVGANFKLRFKNVVFSRSLSGTYPTSWYFAWSNSSVTDPDVVFDNCSFATVPSGIEINVVSSKTRYFNCVFGNASVTSKNEGCLFNATFDVSWRITSAGWKDAGVGADPDGTKRDIGVYGGELGWSTYTLKLETKYEIELKLPTGGVTSTDKDNDWDRYVVGSAFNGAITAGDNSVWNWKDVYSYTSTVGTSQAGSRVKRGYTAVTTWHANSIANSGTTYAGTGFRPMVLFSLSGTSFEGGLNTNSTEFDDIILSGVMKHGGQLAVKYSISLNGTQLYPEIGLTPLTPTPFNVSHIIDDASLRLGDNLITLLMEDSQASQISQTFTVTKLNAYRYLIRVGSEYKVFANGQWKTVGMFADDLLFIQQGMLSLDGLCDLLSSISFSSSEVVTEGSGKVFRTSVDKSNKTVTKLAVM